MIVVRGDGRGFCPVIHKMYLNRVYEVEGLSTGTNYYLEQVAIMGAQPAPGNAEFSKMAAEKGLVPH
ncbi:MULTISPECIES: hypothetical protein [unclassified Mesorhizobium]|uniref:hypothetical protein n=1 Tax=unclassified Mesorhizobium TaxID=325217 RepID=UPI00333AEEDE